MIAFLNLAADCMCLCSCLILCDPWTVARQAPPSMGFPRQEYWSGLPFPPPEDLTAPGVKLLSPGLALNHLGGLGMDHIDLLTIDGASQEARW